MVSDRVSRAPPDLFMLDPGIDADALREAFALSGRVQIALTLFDVPQDHSVSLVSRFAPGPRYSVTGWMRARAGA